MVWGRSHAAREAPEIDVDAPIPASASCARCETPVILAAGKLPRGWVEVEGEAICPDCAWSKSKQRRAIETGVRHVTIGSKRARYSGCRIQHEYAGGFVGLRIHGGASRPPNSRDEPVQFMLDRQGLDRLIQHLCDVRKDLPHG